VAGYQQRVLVLSEYGPHCAAGTRMPYLPGNLLVRAGTAEGNLQHLAQYRFLEISHISGYGLRQTFHIKNQDVNSKMAV